MDKELTEAGFDVTQLTEAQKELIMQPSYAPENYHHDGEVSPRQALEIWKSNLKRAGLSHSEITRAVKMQLG